MINEARKDTATIELVAGECLSSCMESERIESAITATAIAAKDADGVTLLILQRHLNLLCRQQRKFLQGLGAAI